MAKNDLIGGTLWEQYSTKVNDRMTNPRYLGEITEGEAKEMGAKLVIADWGAEVCGDAIRLYWAVDPKSDTILLARYKTFGCGTAIASSDVMAEMCIGKTVDEVLKITNIDVEKALRNAAHLDLLGGSSVLANHPQHRLAIALVVRERATVVAGNDRRLPVCLTAHEG